MVDISKEIVFFCMINLLDIFFKVYKGFIVVICDEVSFDDFVIYYV